MTNPVLLMLIERLLWPIPRVRWEAARSLATLIREEDNNAASALLDWIHARRLESEVALGLGIIDAFCLGDYFEFAEVTNSIRAPSLLSDFLLKRNFTDASGLSPTRYTTSPSEPASLRQHEEEWFDLYREEAVPPIFSYVLTQLQEETGFPFMMDWQYEWRWLQATNPRPEIRRPSFFFGGRPYLPSYFLTGQRELYLSAYLRTLATAAKLGSLTLDEAESYATLALSMNRGLAGLEPVARPDWTLNLLSWDARDAKVLVQRLWEDAQGAVTSGESPIALRVVEFDEDSFVEFDLALTVGPPGFTEGPAVAKTHDILTLGKHPVEMAGPVGRNADIRDFPIEYPLVLAQGIMPKALGCVHIELVNRLKLASPYVFGIPAIVQCTSSQVHLEKEGEIISRWVHWYTDWEPAIFQELDSTVGSITTVSRSKLDKLCTLHGLDIALLVRGRRATRRELSLGQEVRTETFWM